METPQHLIEPLLEKIEGYSKTSFELLKLKSVDKLAGVISSTIARLIFVITFSFFLLILSISISLWVGELLEKVYYGFLVVASFYGLISMVLFFVYPKVKSRISDTIISQLLN